VVTALPTKEQAAGRVSDVEKDHTQPIFGCVDGGIG